MKTQYPWGLAILSSLLVAVLLTGCAKMPEDALQAAQAALAAADSAEAGVYLPDMYQAAQDSFAAAQAEIAAQAEKLGPSRSYGRTRQALMSTAEAAGRAASGVAARKEQLSNETQQILTDLPKTIATLNRNITRAARQRAKRDAANAAKESVTQANKLLADARAALNGGDLVGAHGMATEAKQMIDSAAESIS